MGDTLMSSTVSAPALENLLYEKKAGIAYVTLNRPKVLNALNQRTWEELRTVFEDARDDESVHGVIVIGSGDKAFIAGADISELAHLTAVDAAKSSRFGQAVLDLIENLGKPVIAAVNGFALGGGCETAMACTIRVAVEHAKFGQPEVALGLLPGGGGTQRLPRLVGKGRALQLILSGEMISAQEAHRIGLVNEIVPAADLITRAKARAFCSKRPTSASAPAPKTRRRARRRSSKSACPSSRDGEENAPGAKIQERSKWQATTFSPD